MMKKQKKMQQQLQFNNPCVDEQGVAIITVLLILVLLTITGIVATRTVINEKQIVRSDAIFEQSFYYAEAGSLEGVQKLENESEPEELLPNMGQLNNNANLLVPFADTDDPFSEAKNLDVDGDNDFDADDLQFVGVGAFDASETDTAGETFRRVVQVPTEGVSLALGASRIYGYMSYGMTTSHGGKATIKLGYRKRF
jgi:PilX N-terminal